MRATTEDRPSPYLAGNRLVELNEDLVWLPLERPLLALTLFDASIEDSGQLRFEMSNHQFPTGNIPTQRIDVQSLASHVGLIVTPRPFENLDHGWGFADRVLTGCQFPGGTTRRAQAWCWILHHWTSFLRRFR